MTPNTTLDSRASARNDQLIGGVGGDVQESVTRYVVVNVNGNFYGMATDSTVELMSASMTMVTRVPHSLKFIEGVINHRGTIIPVIDARTLLGFARRGKEVHQIETLFKQFKGDHCEWIDALQECVNENTPPRMTQDPDKCSFGRWFNSVMNASVVDCREHLLEPVVLAIIKRFDVPHRRIHSGAKRVLELRDSGQLNKAIEMIDALRETEFKELCELFNQAMEAIGKNEQSMLVITEHEGQKAAIAVDGVSFVADCRDSDIQALPDTADNTEFLSGLVHRPDGNYILIADLGNIYSTACMTKQ